MIMIDRVTFYLKAKNSEFPCMSSYRQQSKVHVGKVS